MNQDFVGIIGESGLRTIVLALDYTNHDTYGRPLEPGHGHEKLPTSGDYYTYFK